MDISIRPAGYDRFVIEPQSPKGRSWIVKHLMYQAGAKANVTAEAAPELAEDMRKDKLLVDVQ